MNIGPNTMETRYYGLIHEFSITRSIARQPLLMADQAWFFLISNEFNGLIFNNYGICYRPL